MEIAKNLGNQERPVSMFTWSSLRSFGSDSEWTSVDSSKSHCIMLLFLMMFSYTLQVISFIFAMLYISSKGSSGFKPYVLFQPFLECISISVVLFLGLFQFQALCQHKEKVLKVISIELHYVNITTMVLFTTVFATICIFSSRLTSIYQVIAGIVLFSLYSLCYCKLRLLKNPKVHIQELLGFNILHSIALPLILLEIVNSLISLINFNSDHSDLIVSITTSLYFILGGLSLYLLTDIYLGISFSYNIFNIFIVQTQSCAQNTNSCNPSSIVCGLLFTLSTILFILITIYFYPTAYKYEFKNRSSLYQN